MASLLVYVEGARLDELLPESAAGDTWLLGPETIAQPQLERLDEHSWLFIVSGTRCVAVLRNPRIHNGAFMGGAALVSNKDISQVLMRLGCTDGNVAAWAAIPRVLPPSDLDLLRYQLGIADEEDVDEVLPDDDRTRSAPPSGTTRSPMMRAWSTPTIFKTAAIRAASSSRCKSHVRALATSRAIASASSCAASHPTARSH